MLRLKRRIAKPPQELTGDREEKKIEAVEDFYGKQEEKPGKFKLICAKLP